MALVLARAHALKAWMGTFSAGQGVNTFVKVRLSYKMRRVQPRAEKP